MAGNRTHFLSLLENEHMHAFCAYASDFAPFRAQISEHNLFADFDKGIEKCVFMDQFHSNKVLDFDKDNLNLRGDGLLSSQKKLALCVLSADCLPLLLWHEAGFIVALHSGRQGCFSNILKQALLLLEQKQLEASKASLIIGAEICAKNYQISGEILEEARAKFKDFLTGDRLDLKGLVRAQAKKLGVGRIYESELCSFENELFYSYRRDKSAKRFASVIYLKG